MRGAELASFKFRLAWVKASDYDVATCKDTTLLLARMASGEQGRDLHQLAVLELCGYRLQ